MLRFKPFLKKIYLLKWWLLFIIACLTLVVYVIKTGSLDKFSWDVLNKNSGAVQALSTITLIFITAFYALQTKKTNKLISFQVFPKIFLEPEALYSSLEPNEIAEFKKEISGSGGHTTHRFRFRLAYKALNNSASSGSTERPKLLIENLKNGEKKYLSPDVREVVVDTTCKGEVKNTIYLKPGEMKNIKDDFFFEVSSASSGDMDFINNVSNLQYTVFYKDIVGNQPSVILRKENILPFDY